MDLSPAEDPLLNALRARVGDERASACRVARFLGVNSEALLAWVEGRRQPRRATRERIAAFLKGRTSGGPVR
jgi:hypothetical protein